MEHTPADSLLQQTSDLEAGQVTDRLDDLEARRVTDRLDALEARLAALEETRDG